MVRILMKNYHTDELTQPLKFCSVNLIHEQKGGENKIKNNKTAKYRLLGISLALVMLLGTTSFDIFAQESIDVDQEYLSYNKIAYHHLYSSDGKLSHILSKAASLQASNESIKQLSEKSIKLDSTWAHPLAGLVIPKTNDEDQYDKIDTIFGLELEDLDIYLKQRYSSDTISDLFYKVTIVVDINEEYDDLPSYLVMLTDKKTNDILIESAIFPRKTLSVLVNVNQFSELDKEEKIIKINPVHYLKTLGNTQSASEPVNNVEEVAPLSLKVNLLKPYQQMKNGLLPYQIECNDKFELLIQNSLTKSICVMPDSVETLQKRGWY